MTLGLLVLMALPQEPAALANTITRDLSHALGDLPTVDWSTLGARRPSVAELKALKKEMNLFCGPPQHAVDLNGDGSDELIFSGPCKPYPETEIYARRKGRWTKIARTAGGVLRVERHAKYATIVILMQACCCIANDNLILLDITQGKELRLQETLVQAPSPMRKSRVTMTRPIVVGRGGAALRDAPAVVDRDEDDCGIPRDGNIAIHYAGGTRGWALHEREVKGKRWLFVLMQPAKGQIRIPEEADYPLSGEHQYSLGWIMAAEVGS